MPVSPDADWATVAEAARRLKKASGTIASWGTRYRARKIRINGITYWCLKDLRVIEREIMHGHPVPATPQERQEIRLRCPLRDRYADAA